MLRFALRRSLQIVPTVIVVALLIFVIFSVVPGSFAASLFADGKRAADPQMMARLTQELGLDKPLTERFVTYVTDLARFDLGTSFRTRQPVIDLINDRMWASLIPLEWAVRMKSALSTSRTPARVVRASSASGVTPSVTAGRIRFCSDPSP